MNYRKLLSNKWVWIGGAGLGAILLLGGRGSAGASSGDGALAQAVVMNAAQMNQVGTAAAIESQKIEAAKAVETIKANAAYAAQMFSFMGSENAYRGQLALQREETRRSIGIAEIGASAARDIEAQQTTRAVTTALVSGVSQSRVIAAQGDAAARLARANKPTTGELIAGTVSNVAKVAKFFF